MKKIILGLLTVTFLMGTSFLGTDLEPTNNSVKIDQSSHQVAKGIQIFMSRDEIIGS